MHLVRCHRADANRSRRLCRGEGGCNLACADAFEAAKALREEQLTREAAAQQRKIAEMERFITRFRAKATKAKQVQSRVKKLEKLDLVEPPRRRKIVESIRKFPDQETFAGMIREAGFGQVRYRNLSLGIAALHSGWKL